MRKEMNERRRRKKKEKSIHRRATDDCQQQTANARSARLRAISIHTIESKFLSIFGSTKLNS
jgi:hypothetical protein